MRKRLLCICLIGALLMGVGCEKESEVTLKTVSMFGPQDSAGQAYAQLLTDFQSANGHIVLEDWSETSNEAWKAAVVAQFENPETTPDVVFFFSGIDARELILDSQFVDFDEIRKYYPDYAQEIRPSSQGFLREFDGSYYAVPLNGFWEGIFCNKDLFDRYNLPLPRDWESLLQAVSTFRANGIDPFSASFGEIPHYWIEHIILASGGSLEHQLNPKGYIPQSWVEGFEALKMLYDLGAFNEDCLTVSHEEAGKRFVDKEAAMLIEGSWFTGQITDTEQTVVVPMPAIPGGRKDPSSIISGFSTGFYITTSAWADEEKRDAAVKFVTYMTSAESMALVCQNGAAPAMDIPAGGSSSPLKQSSALLQSEAKGATMPVDSRLSKEAWQYLCGQMPDFLAGKLSAQQLVTEMVTRNGSY